MTYVVRQNNKQFKNAMIGPAVDERCSRIRILRFILLNRVLTVFETAFHNVVCEIFCHQSLNNKTMTEQLFVGRRTLPLYVAGYVSELFIGKLTQKGAKMQSFSQWNHELSDTTDLAGLLFGFFLPDGHIFYSPHFPVPRFTIARIRPVSSGASFSIPAFLASPPQYTVDVCRVSEIGITMTTGWLLCLLVLASSQSVRTQNTTHNVQKNSSIQRMDTTLDNQHQLLETLLSRLGKYMSHVAAL